MLYSISPNHLWVTPLFVWRGSMIEVQCVVFCPPTGSSELIGMNIHCKSTWQNLKMHYFTIWIAYIAKMSITYMFYYYAKLFLVYQKVRLWKQRLKLEHCCPLIKLPAFSWCQPARAPCYKATRRQFGSSMIWPFFSGPFVEHGSKGCQPKKRKPGHMNGLNKYGRLLLVQSENQRNSYVSCF